MKTKGGIIQIYIGNGKGKTTAAFGQALRALGQGLNVAILQFMKNGEFGETKPLAEVYPDYKFLLEQYGSGDFIGPKGPTLNDIHYAEMGIQRAKEILEKAYYDVLILDELLDTIKFNLLHEDDIESLLNLRPHKMELVLTGRDASPKIMQKAKLISRVDSIRHPYEDGISARKGIEY